ncbi:MAG: hypothetical protein QXI91_07660 [Candidatus Bathyarchaeia archaeon]
MTVENENEINVKDFDTKLFTTILQYYNKNKNKNTKYFSVTSIRIDPHLYDEFLKVTEKFGVAPRREISRFIAGIMQMIVDKFKNSPMIVQTTLFYKPQINVKAEVNIVQMLELKLVKQDLRCVLDALDKGKGDKDFYVGKLREVLSRALRVAAKIGDEELTALLKKAERFI